jgi:hypothetical protein
MSQQPLTVEQHAITVALGIARFKNYKDESIILSVVNKLLTDSGHPSIDKERFDKHVLSIQRANLMKMSEDGEYWEILASDKARKERSQKNSQLDDARRLQGASVFLECNNLLTKHQISYIIEYNCDGAGSSRLPTGEVVNNNLNALCNLAHDTSGKPRTSGNGGGADMWIVVRDHHPNAPAQKTKRIFRTYLHANYPAIDQ